MISGDEWYDMAGERFEACDCGDPSYWSSFFMKLRLILDIFMKLPVGIGAESKVLGVVIGPVRGGLGMDCISAAFLISSKTPLDR